MEYIWGGILLFFGILFIIAWKQLERDEKRHKGKSVQELRKMKNELFNQRRHEYVELFSRMVKEKDPEKKKKLSDEMDESLALRAKEMKEFDEEYQITKKDDIGYGWK